MKDDYDEDHERNRDYRDYRDSHRRRRTGRGAERDSDRYEDDARSYDTRSSQDYRNDLDYRYEVDEDSPRDGRSRRTTYDPRPHGPGGRLERGPVGTRSQSLSNWGRRSELASRYGGRGAGWRDRDHRDHDDYDDEDRGFFERAVDEVQSWFGDDDASRRRAEDHRGRGPKAYRRSDSRIEEDVNDRLTDDHRLDATDIQVTVSNAEVTLNGYVASRRDKRRAEDVADSVSGVRHVQNNLRVRDPDRDTGSAQSDLTTTDSADHV